MRKADYLSDPKVKDIIIWMTPLFDEEGAFVHRYVDRRSGLSWQCSHIYDAFM